MEGLKRLLFEDPFWLYGFCVIAAGILAWIWYQQRTRRAALRLLIPLGAGLLFYTVATVVVTDRERIQRAVQSVVKDANAGSVTALEEVLDSDFRGTFQGKIHNKSQAISLARQALQRHGVSEVSVKKIDITIKGVEATTRLQARFRLSGQSIQGQLPLILEFQWIKRGKRWTIVHASQPRIGASL